MGKICIIIPFFGRWPEWVELYLETCKYNSTIKWLFFSDLPDPKNKVDNVEFIKTTLKDLNLLISKNIDFGVCIENIYKLCDFKPMYGVIFEDYLKEYDFWGYADIDVVYGNIRKFITDEILEKCDIITSRPDFLAGHFTIYRNCEKINNLYKKIPGYKDILQNDKCCAFDEIYMTDLAKGLTKKGHLKTFFKKIIREDHWPVVYPWGRKWKVYWNKGKLIYTRTRRELAYFHFINSKEDDNFLIPEWRKGIDSFYLSGRMHRLRGHIGYKEVDR